jgi:hypothetical protein
VTPAASRPARFPNGKSGRSSARPFLSLRTGGSGALLDNRQKSPGPGICGEVRRSSPPTSWTAADPKPLASGFGHQSLAMDGDATRQGARNGGRIAPLPILVSICETLPEALHYLGSRRWGEQDFRVREIVTILVDF